VGVTVNVRVVADGDVVAEPDAAAIIEQNVAVDDDVVAHLHVVAEGELDMLERLEVLAAPPEDVRREDPPELDAQIDVLASGDGAVERIPEPEERLHALELRLIAVGVVLGLEGDVARIERRQGDARAEGNRRILDRFLPRRRIPWIGQLGEHRSAEERAVARRIGEARRDPLEPCLGEIGSLDGRELSKRE
jgi:hypothetical protein